MGGDSGARNGNGLRRVAWAIALGMIVIGAGCGGERTQPTAATTVPAEIRGEPIRSPLAATNAESQAATPTAPENVAAPAQAQPPAAASASAAPAASNPAKPEPANPVETVGTPDAPLVVGFDRLASFKYDVPSDPIPTNQIPATVESSQIPQEIQRLDKQFVSLKGFMLPLKVESGLVTELLIMRDQSMCCFGAVPKINEWVSVKMVGKGVKPIMDQAITMLGRLHVGEIRENGYLVGIYQMDGDRVIGPLDL